MSFYVFKKIITIVIIIIVKINIIMNDEERSINSKKNVSR
jgi:hypothetical protein